jgi:hypothetical protein
MNNKDKLTLSRAAGIIRRLNTNNSKWLNEITDSLDVLVTSADAIERVNQKSNRVPAAMTPQVKCTHEEWYRVAGTTTNKCCNCEEIIP